MGAQATYNLLLPTVLVLQYRYWYCTVQYDRCSMNPRRHELTSAFKFFLAHRGNMAANWMRSKGSMLAAAGGIYIGACYIGYNAVQKNKADIEETHVAVRDGTFSFVSNENRTERFQIVAEKYDNEIGRDESVMGINLLRRSLLYFHAKGFVLEVGAGTGRNIGKILFVNFANYGRNFVVCSLNLVLSPTL